MANESFWDFLLQIFGMDPETPADELGVLYVPGG